MSTTRSDAVDWTNASIPNYDELPAFKNFPGCAWGVWGADDQLGTVNLLTETVVKQSAAEEIRTGKTVSLNWPLNFPEKPMFGRLPPEIKLIQKQKEGRNYSRDDEIHINTQSGTQWDGLRHFPILEHETFYNNTPASALPQGVHLISDPQNIDPATAKIGIQNWADHGICGRAVLVDLVKFLSKDGILPYDPWTTHSITVPQIEACAKAQGVQFRRGDILMLRVGFMKRFLWDKHFAAIASDQPALERWPPPAGTPHMHQTILGLWGMPIGEMFDLEKLSEVCSQTHRYSFFLSSWPLNIIGGAASPPNAAAFF
ncbi:hypothetical protein C8R43DRAFT_1016383 [Mycena crocata]|nr:hypothetical protein C8R43DRAFT_1016383 [Mycena crocata]